jgi:hypothetical protein
MGHISLPVPVTNIALKVIREAVELNEKINKKNDENKGERADAFFLEDYLDFLEKYCGVKI